MSLFPVVYYSGGDAALSPPAPQPSGSGDCWSALGSNIVEMTGCLSTTITTGDIIESGVVNEIMAKRMPIWIKVGHDYIGDSIQAYVDKCEKYVHTDGTPLSTYIHGYMPFDEPDLFNKSPDFMREVVRRIKMMTHRLVWVNVAGYNPDPAKSYKNYDYLAIGDITTFDNYCWEDSHWGGDSRACGGADYYLKTLRTTFKDDCRIFLTKWLELPASVRAGKIIGAILQGFDYVSACYDDGAEGFAENNRLSLSAEVLAAQARVVRETVALAEDNVTVLGTGAEYQFFSIYTYSDQSAGHINAGPSGHPVHNPITPRPSILCNIRGFTDWLKAQGWYSRYTVRKIYDPSLQQTVMPAVSLGGGWYATPQSVEITCDDGSATIRYTTDGTFPSSTNGTVIASGQSINISSSLTLMVVAYRNGYLDSEILTASFVIAPVPPKLVLSHTSGQIPMLVPGTVVLTANRPVALWTLTTSTGFSIYYPDDTSISITTETGQYYPLDIGITAQTFDGETDTFTLTIGSLPHVPHAYWCWGDSWPEHRIAADLSIGATGYLAVSPAHIFSTVSADLTVSISREPIALTGQINSATSIGSSWLSLSDGYLGNVSSPHTITGGLTVLGPFLPPVSYSVDPRVAVRFEEDQWLSP